MTSKHQKNLFPIEQLAKMRSIIVKTVNGESVEIDYQDLKLITVNNQICWFYESLDGNLIMPICRISTLNKVIEKVS